MIVCSLKHTHTHTEVCYTFKLYNNTVYSRIAFMLQEYYHSETSKKSNSSFILLINLCFLLVNRTPIQFRKGGPIQC